MWGWWLDSGDENGWFKGKHETILIKIHEKIVSSLLKILLKWFIKILVQKCSFEFCKSKSIIFIKKKKKSEKIFKSVEFARSIPVQYRRNLE